MSFSTTRLTTLSLYAALALAIYGAESMLPPLFPLPGMKLGLANIITLLVMKKYGTKDAFFVLLCRILLSALLFGQPISLLYSLCGGLLCYAAMYCVNRLLCGKLLLLTSMFGALLHNLGQLFIALLLTRTIGVLTYLPLLIISGILTGAFTGLCAYFSLQQLRRFTE